jgi:hypothetical protein
MRKLLQSLLPVASPPTKLGRWCHKGYLRTCDQDLKAYWAARDNGMDPGDPPGDPPLPWTRSFGGGAVSRGLTMVQCRED